MFYAPALKLIPDHCAKWFVDTNIEAAEQTARIYGQGKVTDNYAEIVDKVDAAIVAVPNFLHSRVSIDFLRQGRDVFCEKPIAMSVEEGSQMIRVAQESRARLAVNLIRRRYDSYRVARRIIRQGLIGQVERVTVEEGDVLDWPFASSFMLEKGKAGGGVLIDWGSHVIDVLHWIFDGELEVLSYEDDGLGRVEADCEAELQIRNDGNEVPCRIRLSRARRLKNTLAVDGDKGCLEVRGYDRSGAYLFVGDHFGRIQGSMSGREKTETDYFADQIRAFTDKSSPDIVDGNEALKSLKVIQECYRKRQDMTYPWEDTRKSVVGRSIASRYEKVLVVGASGFVGTRLVEKLTLDLNAKVRVTIHRPERAARLGRLPVEYMDCDVLEPIEVMRAVDGCDVVVNCAKDRSRDDSKILDVFVRGTQNLLEAAARHRVKKFVHISSAGVHGFKHESKLVNESAAMRSSVNSYYRGKIASENLVMSYAGRLPVVVLRPTLIYGPFSDDWVTNVVHMLRDQALLLIGNDKVANLVYIDDVVDAILLAIENDEANGKVFLVNDDEQAITWEDYVQEYSNMLGITPQSLPDRGLVSMRLRAFTSLLWDSMTATKNVLCSREMMSLIARIPLVLIVGTKLVRKRRSTEATIASRPRIGELDPRTMVKYQTIGKDLYEVFTCRTVFSASRARSTLGFEPATSFVEGMGKTREWITWAGLA
jgi:nucleoside-diphosphate-sugar epimerase/predicted dehydrogenase